MRIDPPQREDRLCARHGCKKPLPDIAWREGDPFCSNVCAQRHHRIKFGYSGEAQSGRAPLRRTG